MRKYGIFPLWFISYLVTLFIPILFFVGFQFQSQNLLETEIERSNDALLTQVQHNIDYQLNDITRLSVQLLNDPRMTYFLHHLGGQDPQWKLNAADLISSFSNYRHVKGIISDFYVYVNASDRGLTTSTLNDGELIYTNYHKSVGMKFDDWTALMKRYDPGVFVNLGGDTPANIQLAYLRTLSFPYMDREAVKLVVLLDNENMLQALSNVKLTSVTSVLIMDSSQHVVVSTDVSAPPMEVFANHLDDVQGTFETKWADQGDVTVSYLRSEQSDWIYLTVTPTKVYAAGMSTLRQWIGWYLVLCTGIGVLIAYWMTRRSYRPIGNMVNFATDKVRTNPQRATNEFAFLQAFMKESVTRQNEAERRLEEQHQTMRGNFLIRLLRGKTDTSSALMHALERYEFSFMSDLFMVVLVQLEGYSGLFRTEMQDDAEKREQFVHLIVTNIMEEMLKRHHQAYSVEIDGKIAFLVNVPDKTGQAAKNTFQAANEAQQFIRDKFFIACSIGISDIHMHWRGIAQAYQEALETLEYKFILGSNHTITCEMVKRPKEELYYPLEIEHKLINHISIGNYEEAANVVYQVLNTNFSNGTLSIQLGKCLMFELTGTMLKAVEQIKLSSKEIELEKKDLFRSMVRCETIAEMEIQIISFLKSVCDYLHAKKKSHNTDLRDEMKAFIMDNLHDSNLSLTMISLQFNMNPSYLSRFFKEQAGENLIDFINKQRVEHAKALLRDSSITINEILEKQGFSSNNTFTRVFKRYEGMTPSQYRQMFEDSDH